MTAKVLGHRGCRGEGNPPENSLAAFKAAVAQGADGIELDLFLSRDGHLVVFHDDTLERMTDGAGVITSYSLSELQSLRLKNITGQLSSEIIPTYAQVLDALEAYCLSGSFTINTEIKGRGIARHVAQAIERRVKEGWRLENFIVSSFDMQSLQEMRELNPSIAVGALFVGGKAPWDITESWLAEQLNAVRDIHPDTINITYPSLTPRALALIKQAGAVPVAWTCDEVNPDALPPSRMDAMVKHLTRHAIIIITDYPAQMIRHLRAQ